MKPFFLILVCSFTSLTYTQDKNIEYPMEKNGDKSFTYLHFKKIITDLRINSIENTKYDFHFRYISLRNITEIWKNEKGEIQGENIIFLEKEKETVNKQKEYLVKTTSIESKKLTKIYQAILKLRIDTIESKMNVDIDNKKKHLILMEFADQKNYKFKEFWVHNSVENQTPSEMKIVKLDALLNKEIDYSKLYKDIITHLPKGCYNLVNGFVKCEN